MTLVVERSDTIPMTRPGLREAIRLTPGEVFYCSDGQLHTRLALGAVKFTDESTTSDYQVASAEVVTEGQLQSRPYQAVTVLADAGIKMSLIDITQLTKDEVCRAQAAGQRAAKRHMSDVNFAKAVDSGRLGG